MRRFSARMMCMCTDMAVMPMSEMRCAHFSSVLSGALPASH